MSGTEGRSNATFQSSSPTTMGVANKMSADERSQQVVVSVSKLEREVGRKSSAQEDEDEQASRRMSKPENPNSTKFCQRMTRFLIVQKMTNVLRTG